MIRCSSIATLGSLLVGLGCNALLGIDESTCIGPCDEPAPERSVDSRSRDGDTANDPEQADAGGGAPRTRPGAANTAANDAENQQELDALIAARCATDDSAQPFCIDNDRVTCGAGGAPASVSVCASADHCNRGSGARCAECTSQSVCQGAELWRCDTQVREMVLAETCASAALCDAAGGACVVAACLPEQTRCQGASFETCNASGTGFVRLDQCQSAVACDPEAGCEEPPCSAGERRCAGGSLQECNASGTGFDNVRSCGGPALCNADENRCNTCVPGARRCASPSTVATCDASGLTEATRACRPVVEACEEGECVSIGDLPL